MILNFRKPTFVLTGAWNKEILNRPEWLGRFVYDYEEGRRVEALQVFEETPVIGLTRLIQYIENIGFLVEKGRLSIFLNVDTNFEDIFTSLEEKVIKVVSTLLHTPIGGYGVNFSFEIQSPSDTLLESFNTVDRIQTRHPVKGVKHSIALEYEDGVTLNLIKENLEDHVNLDFNYHHEKFVLKDYKEHSRGSVFNFYKKTLNILKDCYEVDVEQIIVQRHSFKGVASDDKEKNN